MKQAPDIHVMKPVAEQDALELFNAEASPESPAELSAAASDPPKVGFNSAAERFGPPSNIPTQQKPRPPSVTDGPRFTPRSYEPAVRDLSYQPIDRGLLDVRQTPRIPVRSRPLVWLLLSAPVVVFAVLWFAGFTEVRSALAAMMAQTSRAPESAPPSAAGPLVTAGDIELAAPSPSTSNDDHSTRQPTAEQPANPPASIQEPAPPRKEAAPSPSRAVARSSVQASSPATNVQLAGTLSIDSRPVGASVFIDERLVGTTPLLLPDIPPGAHVVRMELAGHREWQSTVQVVPNVRNRVTARLEEVETAPER